jgi:hypothetical protein
MTKSEWIEKAEAALKAMRPRRRRSRIESLLMEIHTECQHHIMFCSRACPFLLENGVCDLNVFSQQGRQIDGMEKFGSRRVAGSKKAQ